jgi:streptogramin lyase
MFSSSGVYESEFGGYGSGNGQLFQPRALTLDTSGDIWVDDSSNDRVEEFTASGGYISQFAVSSATDGIAIDANGTVWVSEYLNDCVAQFNSSGTYLCTFGSYGAGPGLFNDGPAGIVIE